MEEKKNRMVEQVARAKDVFYAALAERKMTIKGFAQEYGWNEVTLVQKILMRETILACDFFKIMDDLKIDVVISDKETGEVIWKDSPVDVEGLFMKMIGYRGISQYEASRRSGYHEQLLTQKIRQRNTISMEEMFHVIDAIGFVCRFYPHGSDKQLQKKQGSGERIAGTSNGVMYSTSKARLIATSMGKDHNEYGSDGIGLDVYEDLDDRKFVVEYNKEDKPKIKTVPEHEMDALIQVYGTDEPV